MLFHHIAAQATKKRVIITHFTMKIICTYLYINSNKKILFVKKYLACCEYSPTSPFFLLFSEHKHCDNAATNSNSENAKRRMVASLRGRRRMGTKKDELSTERIWAAGFHHVTARSLLASVLKLNFTIFYFGSQANRG
jgi:hypothetical protein